MSVRRSARTDKPLAPIDNILNSAHVPVYRRLKLSSIRKKSMADEAKLHLYDFETENLNGNDGKKFKKSQKVRKRARIPIRHNKENACKSNGSRNVLKDLHKKPVLKEHNDKAANKVLITVKADVHHGYSPVDDDILSVASEKSDESSPEDEKSFYGFDENHFNDRAKDFIREYGDKSADNYQIESVTPLCKSYMTPHPYLTPNPYMTPNPYKTPRKVASPRNSIPVIEFNETMGNQLEPNRSSENINPNDTFNNSYRYNKYFSTPFKNNSFDSTSVSDLSINDFNVTNCFGFEDPDHLNEECLLSPIKLERIRPAVRVRPLEIDAPCRPQLPSVHEIIDKLKKETEDDATKPTTLFQPEVDISVVKSSDLSNYINSSSLDYISQELTSEMDANEPKLTDVTGAPQPCEEIKRKPVRRSYERPVYLRQRRLSNAGESDVEDKEEEPGALNKTRAKKPAKKKPGPTKREVQELEKWAQSFNSQCAQVEAFNLCIE